MPGDHSKTPRNADLAGDGLSRSVIRVEELFALLAEVDAFLSWRSIPAPLARRTRLVVEELVTNAFRHGGADGTGGVVVELRGGSALPEGSISYVGPAFDPTVHLEEPGDSGRRLGGQGLQLIQGLTRRLEFSREGEVNRVEFEITTNDKA